MTEEQEQSKGSSNEISQVSAKKMARTDSNLLAVGAFVQYFSR